MILTTTTDEVSTGRDRTVRPRRPGRRRKPRTGRRPHSGPVATGRQGDAMHFRNPSGHTTQAHTASLSVAEFAEFFGGRGVSLT